MRPAGNNSGPQKLVIDPSNILKYETWDKFKNAAKLSDADSDLMSQEGWDDLEVLSTTVSLVVDSNDGDFLKALREHLPKELTHNGCIRLITAMRNAPTSSPPAT